MDNVELVRTIMETFNRHGIEATQEWVHPKLEVHPFPEWPGPNLYLGMEGLTRLVDEWTENFDDYRWDLHRVLDAGEEVVILAHHGGHTRGQGVWVEQPVSGIFLIDGGRVRRMDYFLTWDEALQAAELQE